jgi:hypothetical protein
LKLTPLPGISGNPRIGSTLEVLTGSWDSGLSFSYQWMRQGQQIPNATKRNYVVKWQDLGQSISVAVTGIKAFFDPVTTVSASMEITTLPLTAPCGKSSKNMSLKEYSKINSPKITGPPNFGNSIKATKGVWSPGTAFCVFWLADNSPLAKANLNVYKIQSSDIGKTLNFVVVGSKGNASVIMISNPITILKGTFGRIQKPVLIGKAQVLETLSAEYKRWESGTRLKFNWLRNGSSIGWGKTIYTPNASDVGARLAFQVCGSKTFYTSQCVTSQETPPIEEAVISKIGSISITGSSLKVGSVLTATSTAWMQGVSLTYQWRLNGLPIEGSTNRQIVVQPEYLGKTLSFQIIATLEGYSTIVKFSKGKKIA